jgi:hypothetical protein
MKELVYIESILDSELNCHNNSVPRTPKKKSILAQVLINTLNIARLYFYQTILLRCCAVPLRAAYLRFALTQQKRDPSNSNFFTISSYFLTCALSYSYAPSLRPDPTLPSSPSPTPPNSPNPHSSSPLSSWDVACHCLLESIRMCRSIGRQHTLGICVWIRGSGLIYCQ